MHPRNLRAEDIAKAMRITEAELWYTVRHTERMYMPTRPTVTPKGKVRMIDEPWPIWKRRLKGLHKFFQREFRPPRYVHGGIKGRSCFTSAHSHKGRKYVLTRDIQDCYPSILTDQLRRQLRKVGFGEHAARLLGDLLTVHGYVPQGSPVSGDAQNLFFWHFDRILVSACRKQGAEYGRMCDDILSSCKSLRAAKCIGNLIDREVGRIGLSVGEGKLRNHGIQPNHQLQMVHNLVVNRPDGVGINRKLNRGAIDEAESLVRGARSVSAASLIAIAKKRRRVVGLRCHCQQANFGPSKHLRRLVKQADRHVFRALRKARLIAYRNRWWTITEASRLAGAWQRQREGQATPVLDAGEPRMTTPGTLRCA